MSGIVIGGYSGHSYVAIDIFLKISFFLFLIWKNESKNFNPFGINYVGSEETADFESLEDNSFFIAIGDNLIRKKVSFYLIEKNLEIINCIHPNASIGSLAVMSTGILIASNASINPLVSVGEGVIINTNASFDHECSVGNYCHIGPGATLCGNVKVGDYSFIGARSVIKEGVSIGSNCTIGAGAVAIKNVPDNITVVGSPAKKL